VEWKIEGRANSIRAYDLLTRQSSPYNRQQARIPDPRDALYGGRRRQANAIYRITREHGSCVVSGYPRPDEDVRLILHESCYRRNAPECFANPDFENGIIQYLDEAGFGGIVPLPLVTFFGLGSFTLGMPGLFCS